MVRVTFAPAIQRHVSMPVSEVDAVSVSAALQAVFVQVPKLRDYIVDEQGVLRKHVAVFVDGELLDRKHFSVQRDRMTDIYVAQALSGG